MFYDNVTTANEQGSSRNDRPRKMLQRKMVRHCFVKSFRVPTFLLKEIVAHGSVAVEVLHCLTTKLKYAFISGSSLVPAFNILTKIQEKIFERGTVYVSLVHFIYFHPNATRLAKKIILAPQRLVEWALS